MPNKAHQQLDPQSSADVRRNLRKPLLVLRARLDDGHKAFFGYAKNISRSGMFIASVSPRQPGEQFDVELTLPSPLSMTINCRCEVVWRRTYSRSSDLDPGMGMRFLDLADEVVDAIAAWIEGEESKR